MTRSPRDFLAYGFASTHDAMSAEDSLRDAGVPVTPVPAPRELGALCGIALRVAPGDVAAAEDALKAAGIGWTAKTPFPDL